MNFNAPAAIICLLFFDTGNAEVVMKKLWIVVALIISSTIVVAGEPYYLISQGIGDSSVIAIYGWPDNKTPCVSLEKHMNKTMEEERNYHRFSCVDGTTAMIIDCLSEKNIGSNCMESWQARNSLLRKLNSK